MILARLENGTVVIGIDDGDLRRLLRGPILADLTQLAAWEHTDAVVLLHGRTIDDIEKKLRKLTGHPLPPPRFVSE